ncbi:TPA: hypothetical protein ACTXXA_002814, partial [Legionella anisa]
MVTLFSQRNQTRAIKNLNRYLAAQNLPVRMNPDGVCLGLANVYVKYVVEGREKEYFKMLDHVANLKHGTPYDDRVNLFVTEVLLAFKPDLFDKSKKQRDGIRNLQVDHVALQPFLSFSLVTNDRNWMKIFDSMHLRDGEALTVGIPDHAISISAHKGGYRVCDSNNPDGYVDVSSSKALIKQLHAVAKHYDCKGDLALMIQAVRHPKKPARTDFLSEAQIYEQYLDLTSKTTKTEKGKAVKTEDSLDFAIRTDDLIAFKLILERHPNALNAQNFKDIASYDSTHILQHCIENGVIKRDNLMPMIQQSLIDASPGTFKLLKALDPSFYNASVMAQKNAVAIINNAARGGAPDLLNEILDDYSKKGRPPLGMQDLAVAIRTKLGSSNNSKNAIEAAIGQLSQCGLSNADCVKTLLETLNKAGTPLNEKELLYYTQLAIKTNQPHMVNLFIYEIEHRLTLDSQKELFRSIQLSKKESAKTDPSILNVLSQKKDSLFSTDTPKIEKASGVMSTIGIQFTKFTDWVEK